MLPVNLPYLMLSYQHRLSLVHCKSCVNQRVVIIPGDQSEDGIDGYRGKDFETRKVLRHSCEFVAVVFCTLTEHEAEADFINGERREKIQQLDWWINTCLTGQLLLHCNLVITLMMGAKQKERYNEMSVISK